MEENKNVSKNKWKRIFKKKWFFPAVYLSVAALLLTGVLWYQNVSNQVPDLAEDMEEELNEDLQSNDQDNPDEDATTVMQQQESLQMPVSEDLQVEIVTKFYDYNADAETQEQGLILYENKFYQSDGVAISTSDNQAFDVMASLSGEVVELKQDPLLGNVVKMEHDQGITTYYASLEEIFVEEGTQVEQGQSIGTAGQNAIGQDNGVHVHFEVRKDDTPVNPENFINQPIHKIAAPDEDDAESEEESSEEEASTEDDATEDDSEQEEEDQSEMNEEEQEQEESTDETESSRAMERT
ncbi:M23 family metallopeptidase [Gracilibacillus sp. YIM 98692]|uniref:M23 family metallopeptidase n=1 Tax=Gracilibacillus sp. YIM 98692 TaxID=2663532 RepID=UPI0013D0F68B|nr:M23 family metallopeptidase [Gracilibacillus sp. YIM 98692]